MNSKELRVEMLRFGDTGSVLAAALNMSEVSFSKKLNSNGSEFTQGEMDAIKRRYNLTAERFTEIFFN